MNNSPMSLKGRVRAANKVIEAIAGNGARLLYAPAAERTARLGLDTVEQVWYVDNYSGLLLYPFGNQRWIGFSGDDKGRALVAMLANYAKDATPIDVDALLALLDGYSDEDKQLVRDAIAAALGVVHT